MAIKIKWKLNNQQFDSLEVRRREVTVPITGDVPTFFANAATVVTTLPGTATSYDDDAVVNNKTYAYVVVGIKGTDRVYNTPFYQGYFLNTGPGSQKLLRGDWLAGYFGTVTAAEFFTAPEVNGLLNVAIFTTTPVLYYKFVFRGRILFMPDTRMLQTSQMVMYTNGLMFGTNNNGLFVPATGTATNQRKTIIKNSNEYVVRMPYSQGYTTQPATSYPTTAEKLQSEWSNTYARIRRPVGLLPKFDSVEVAAILNGQNDPGATLFANMYNTTNSMSYRQDLAETEYTIIGNTTAASIIPVFELVLN